ncbi:MAG: hypothetical protein ABI601_20710 [bacterium]
MPEGNGFGAESPAYAAVRWTQFIGLLFLIGTVTFRTFVLSSLRRKQEANARMVNDAEQSAARLGLVAAWILMCTLLLRLFAQSYAMRRRRASGT